MNTTFTENDLILFIYGEAGQSVSADIKMALQTDNVFQEKHRSIIETIELMEIEKFEPHDTSMKIIMEESALFHREEII